MDSPTSAPSTRRAPSAMARAASSDTTGPSGTPSTVELDLGGVGDHRAPEPALAPGTLTSREAARPPVRDSASPRVSPPAASTRATASSMASSSTPNTTSPAASARIAPDRGLLRRRAEPRPASASSARTVTRTLIPSIPLARKAIVADPGGPGRRPPPDRPASAMCPARASARPGLAHPPGADHPAGDDARELAPLGHPALQVGDDGPLEHVGHLVGNAGDGVDDLVAHRADQARGGPLGLGDDAWRPRARRPGGGSTPASPGPGSRTWPGSARPPPRRAAAGRSSPRRWRRG